MKSNPVTDPFLEAAYHGYALRATARRCGAGFQPQLQVRDFRHGSGELIHEQAMDESFSSANAAIDRAMGVGQQIVDDLVTVMHAASA
jgi:hypothetical protein